ncbi:MAG: hypothetical protein HC871_05435 [Rhizobiales bacterium]|nr:hypothetical protein [Hyphomicrobiales bacterium]
MGLAAPSVSFANEYEAQLRNLFEQQLQPWLQSPVLIDAITKQNAEHARLTEGDIDAMDKDWRSQAKNGGGPLISRLRERPASTYLVDKKKQSGELVTEVFVMDNQGLNVAISDVTSDYMQGDEAKWQKTYGQGAGQVFIDEVEFDDSSDTFQCQVSATVVDPSTGKAIGAVTFGINVEEL